VTITSVAGGLQKLADQDGKQGWVPLKAGDKLSPGSIIRVDRKTGGEVGFAIQKDALSLEWTKIHQDPRHNLFQAVALK